MPRSRALAPERRLDLLPGHHRGTRSVGCCHTVDTTWGFKWFDRNESAGISIRPGARDGRTPVPGVWGTEAMGRTLRTLRWSSSMRRARQVATDRRHTFGAAATGRAMRSNQNNSVSVCNRVTMPLTSPGVESEARAITKRKRWLDSGIAALKLDS